jgi:hypothetical protein
MPRSSDSVAALATALAKAQTELVNPEKSLTATLWDERRGQGARTFRYAPLASGLDIVRKVLGQHELAIVQTTGVDQASGTINLTTMLAHKSGEWISSEWPVCRLADMAAPHRMGAALTYARRYALFALVGIAGEDDLDAPDLKARDDASASPMGGPDRHHVQQQQANDDSIDPAEVTPPQRPASRRHDRQLVLDADESATLRAQLLKQIAGLATGDEAIAWARSALPSKNRLTKPDAGMVEQAFEARMGVLNAGMHEEPGHGLAVRPGLDEVTGVPAGAPANLAITAPATPAQTAGRIAPADIDKDSLA